MTLIPALCGFKASQGYTGKTFLEKSNPNQPKPNQAKQPHEGHITYPSSGAVKSKSVTRPRSFCPGVWAQTFPVSRDRMIYRFSIITAIFAFNNPSSSHTSPQCLNVLYLIQTATLSCCIRSQRLGPACVRVQVGFTSVGSTGQDLKSLYTYLIISARQSFGREGS